MWVAFLKAVLWHMLFILRTMNGDIIYIKLRSKETCLLLCLVELVMVLLLSHFPPICFASSKCAHGIQEISSPFFKRECLLWVLGYTEISWAVLITLHKAESKVSRFSLQMLKVKYSVMSSGVPGLDCSVWIRKTEDCSQWSDDAISMSEY